MGGAHLARVDQRLDHSELAMRSALLHRSRLTELVIF